MKFHGIDFYSGFDAEKYQDYDIFFDDGRPFYLKHDSKPKSVVICIHGYTATTYESRPIGEKVFKLGMDAVGPLVPAHGLKYRREAIKSMNKIRFKDWVAAIESEVEKARELYENVFLYGQSMGGAISLAICSRKKIDACALTAPAIKLPSYAMLLWVLGWLPVSVKDNSGNAREFYNVSYDFHNIRSLLELFKLGRYARKNLNKITCPILECHSEQDEIITPKVAQMIKDNSSGPVEVQWFNDSLHTMPLHVQAEEVCDAIGNFFLQIQNKEK